MQRHLWAGVALSTGVFLLPPLRALADALHSTLMWVVYHLLLWSTMGVLVITTHLGGNLTHGPDYLVKYMPASLRDTLGVQTEAERNRKEPPTLYNTLIAPAMDEYCLSCHNSDKHEASLRVDSLGHLLKGGDMGPGIAPGDLKKSEIYLRITLPKDDEEFMPPDGKPSLPPENVEILTWWIQSGLPGDTPLGQIEQDAKITPAAVRARIQTATGELPATPPKSPPPTECKAPDS
jgi:hypothetical protein